MLYRQQIYVVLSLIFHHFSFNMCNLVHFYFSCVATLCSLPLCRNIIIKKAIRGWKGSEAGCSILSPSLFLLIMDPLLTCLQNSGLGLSYSIDIIDYVTGYVSIML